MTIIPPSSCDFVGGEHQQGDSAFEQEKIGKDASGRLVSITTNKTYFNPERFAARHSARVSSREFFSRKRDLTEEWTQTIIENSAIEELIGQLLFVSIDQGSSLQNHDLFPYSGVMLPQGVALPIVKSLEGRFRLPPMIGCIGGSTYLSTHSFDGLMEERFYEEGKKLAEKLSLEGVHFLALPLDESSSFDGVLSIAGIEDRRLWLYIKGIQDMGIGVALTTEKAVRKASTHRIPLFGHYAAKVREEDKALVHMVGQSGMNYVVCKKQDKIPPQTESQGIVLSHLECASVEFLKHSLLSGVDGFIVSPSLIEGVYETLQELYMTHAALEDVFFARIKKFLLVKEWAGLSQPLPIS